MVKRKIESSDNWRALFYGFLDTRLDKIEEEYSMEDLGEISKAVFEERAEILGQLILGFIERKFGHLLNQQSCDCPECGKGMQRQGKQSKTIQTLAGQFELTRPYFYCRACRLGYYPLDEALGLSESSKQYDVQDVEAWLSSETAYETASETYERITGVKLSEHHMHETTNAIGQEVGILDVCPPREEIDKQIENLSVDKFRRPIMMLALDGAHGPMRPEPSPHPRKGKRGKGEYKEIKGFRLYLIDGQTIIHLISWHQVCADHELAEYLVKIKEAGLIPHEKIRLGIIGDGAPWIWNRCKEIFPSAKEILDYYHCSEYVHGVANAHYGKETRESLQWCEATLTRIYYGYHEEVLGGLGKMKARTQDIQDKIDKFYTYLTNHCEKMDYSSAKRGGYHIGSGAIESANKFISHTRLKRSGAWWYIQNANNILKIRCAKYNGTYDKVIEKYKRDDQERIKNKKFKRSLRIVK
ncbi:MAG: ISKra4 family transposase [Candidatus Scalindua sp.]|nr:ISKra4 family transposase [Candidatus Scalindua sp.]MDR4503386.1 ISKra4 family transposase [Candidatus Scalindua sp.]MDR4503573.1 ISKra4 family transposase [Candidatus Scalindua sp.]MDR4503721.1 ISKra4 family transposase [Candidatus Scalindua sp.]MDR4503830.1 ISKra4 family transposase [Candidatus Scalindua sp.]